MTCRPAVRSSPEWWPAMVAWTSDQQRRRHARRRVRAMPPASYAGLVRGNLAAPVALALHAAPWLIDSARAGRGGTVVMMASMAGGGRQGRPGPLRGHQGRPDRGGEARRAAFRSPRGEGQRARARIHPHRDGRSSRSGHVRARARCERVAPDGRPRRGRRGGLVPRLRRHPPTATARSSVSTEDSCVERPLRTIRPCGSPPGFPRPAPEKAPAGMESRDGDQTNETCP